MKTLTILAAVALALGVVGFLVIPREGPAPAEPAEVVHSDSPKPKATLPPFEHGDRISVAPGGTPLRPEQKKYMLRKIRRMMHEETRKTIKDPREHFNLQVENLEFTSWTFHDLTFRQRCSHCGAMAEEDVRTYIPKHTVRLEYKAECDACGQAFLSSIHRVVAPPK